MDRSAIESQTARMDVGNTPISYSLEACKQAYKAAPSDQLRRALYKAAIQTDLQAQPTILRSLESRLLQLKFYFHTLLPKKKKYSFFESGWLQRPHHTPWLEAFLEAAENSGRTKRALQALHVLTEAAPQDFSLLERLASLAAQCNESQIEFEAWERAVELEPQNKRAISALKQAAEKLAMGGNENSSIKKQLEDEPDNISLRMQWIDQQVNVREYAAAIQETEAFLATQSTPDERLERRLYLLKEHHLNFQLAQAQLQITSR